MRNPSATQEKGSALPPQELPSPPAEAARELSHSFPIVGIGASAGGLVALELFLANVPVDSGMAFVIVQHLDPTHKGILVVVLVSCVSFQITNISAGRTLRGDNHP